MVTLNDRKEIEVSKSDTNLGFNIYIFSQLSKFIKDLNENMDIIYDAAFTLFNHELSNTVYWR